MRAVWTRKLTVSLAALGRKTLPNLALVLEIQIPSRFFPVGVLYVKGDNGLGLFQSILTVGFVGLERLVDDVEGGGGRVGIYLALACLE